MVLQNVEGVNLTLGLGTNNTPDGRVPLTGTVPSYLRGGKLSPLKLRFTIDARDYIQWWSNYYGQQPSNWSAYIRIDVAGIDNAGSLSGTVYYDKETIIEGVVQLPFRDDYTPTIGGRLDLYGLTTASFYWGLSTSWQGYNNYTLKLIPDKQEYTRGEKATIAIKAVYKGQEYTPSQEARFYMNIRGYGLPDRGQRYNITGNTIQIDTSNMLGTYYITMNDNGYLYAPSAYYYDMYTSAGGGSLNLNVKSPSITVQGTGEKVTVQFTVV
jgi:hypothetical protein